MEKEKLQTVLYGGLKMNKIRVIDLLKVDSADIWEIHTNDIKSIVTKEQFSQMEYKVGD